MKKFLMILALISAVLLLPACGGDSKTPENDANPKIQQPKNNGDNTEVTEPKNEPKVSLAEIDGWEIVEGSAAIKQYLKEGYSVIATRDIVPSELDTPEKYLDYVKEKFRGTFEGVTFGDASEIGVSDSEKQFLVYNHEIKVGSSNIKMKGWITYIIKDGKAYTLTCAGMTDGFERVEEDLKTFIKSFKVE